MVRPGTRNNCCNKKTYQNILSKDFFQIDLISQKRSSRKDSMADEASLQFEEELFNHCKTNVSDTEATSGILLKVYEHKV